MKILQTTQATNGIVYLVLALDLKGLNSHELQVLGLMRGQCLANLLSSDDQFDQELIKLLESITKDGGGNLVSEPLSVRDVLGTEISISQASGSKDLQVHLAYQTKSNAADVLQTMDDLLLAKMDAWEKIKSIEPDSLHECFKEVANTITETISRQIASEDAVELVSYQALAQLSPYAALKEKLNVCALYSPLFPVLLWIWLYVCL